MNERDQRAQAAVLQALLDKRAPPAWLHAPGLLSAVGATWFDLGEFDKARAALLAAVQAEDREGTVPIHDIEKLANVEARLGERQATVGDETGAATKSAAKAAAAPAGAALIRLAIARLQTLDQLVAVEGGTLHNPERSALLGSAWKRLAGVQARAALQAKTAAARQDAAEAMREALRRSIEAFARDEGRPGAGRFDSYLALNRLALVALLRAAGGDDADAADTADTADATDAAHDIALARQCRQDAQARYALDGNPWRAVMQSDSAMVETLLDGSLGRADEAGAAALDALAANYAATLANLTLRPAQLDSVVTQMELLSRFADALSLDRGNAALYRTADRLLELRQRIHPGKRPRSDRPAPPATAGSRQARTARPQPDASPARTAKAVKAVKATKATKTAGATKAGAKRPARPRP